MTAIAQHQSQSNEHYTPDYMVRTFRDIMGWIDLDPASCELANRTIQAERYFGIDDDGYNQEWSGFALFLNPPGGRMPGKQGSQQAMWMEKAIYHYDRGDIKTAWLIGFNQEIIARVPTLAKYPHCHVLRPCFLSWDEGEGKLIPKTRPTHSTIIFWLPPKNWSDRRIAEVFTEACKDLGQPIIPSKP